MISRRGCAPTNCSPRPSHSSTPNSDQAEPERIFDDIADVVTDDRRHDAARLLERVGIEDAERESIELLACRGERRACDEACEMGEGKNRRDDHPGPAHLETAKPKPCGERGQQVAYKQRA